MSDYQIKLEIQYLHAFACAVMNSSSEMSTGAMEAITFSSEERTLVTEQL